MNDRLSPPSFGDLPKRRPRRTRGGPDLSGISVELEVVTPILGGGFRCREIDEIDAVRPATVRGHLRMWWRALRAPLLGTAAALADAEGRLWGTTSGGQAGRSAVEVRVEVLKQGERDDDEVRPYPSRNGPMTPGAYALWPARGTREQPPAPRRKPGTRFRLTLRCPKPEEGAVRNAVCAWILFGGYGGRTRRGVGSLTVAQAKDRAEWLPEAKRSLDLRAGLETLFGKDILASVASWRPCDLPVLAGASLHVGTQPKKEAEKAWTRALGWLHDFRQGSAQLQGQRAREPAPPADRNRPSISNWPEADKVRQLSPGDRWEHRPRHNRAPVWPRAGFGLPIVGQFQTRGRDRGTRYHEPRGFEIRWREAGGRGEVIEHDRLASPLIVKALPLADGRFLPCALWLERAYPARAEVALKPNDPRSRGSGAPFDELVAPGDEARFAPLAEGQAAANGRRLRTAFLGWLKQHQHTQEVAS